MFTKTMPIVLILTLVLGWSLATHTSHAADVFIKKHPKTEQAPVQNELPAILNEAPLNKPAPAPEPVTINDFANAYYQNCVQQDHPILSGNNLEMLCGCTAAQIPGNMDVEQMRAMQEDSSEGKLQRNRMLMFVYTPCIEYPTRALILDQCLKDPKVKSTMKNYVKVCECLGNGMAGFMKEKAPEFVNAALNRDSSDLDPLRSLLESQGFERQSQYEMKECVYKHELGKGR